MDGPSLDSTSVQRSLVSEYDTTLQYAEGQFVVVDICPRQTGPEETDTRRPTVTKTATRSPESPYARETPFAGHPTPRSPPFEPELFVVVDGTRYAPSETFVPRYTGMAAFDVPARSATSGHVVWSAPERRVQWPLPDATLSKLPKAPSFTRHSVSISGWPSEGIRVHVDVENTSSWPGTYYALLQVLSGTMS
jgi:hypothetical protein